MNDSTRQSARLLDRIDRSARSSEVQVLSVTGAINASPETANAYWAERGTEGAVDLLRSAGWYEQLNEHAVLETVDGPSAFRIIAAGQGLRQGAAIDAVIPDLTTKEQVLARAWALSFELAALAEAPHDPSPAKVDHFPGPDGTVTSQAKPAPEPAQP